MTVLDYPLAAAGFLGHAVLRAVRGSRRGTWVVLVGLLILTAIPIGLVITTPRPTNLSFEDMSLERIPAQTSWGRLKGDFRTVESAAGTQFELHDPDKDDWYVIVFTDKPPPDGRAMITGQISPHRATTGNVGTIVADDPPVPPVDEPIWLYLTPAVLAIVMAVGLRIGYPVIRRDSTEQRGVGAPAQAPATSEPIRGDWSGRIEGVVVAHDRPLACSIAVAPVPDLPDLADIEISEPDRTQTVRIRRATPLRSVRLVRLGGSHPGLEIHASTADLVLSFDDRRDRDRFLAARG